MEIQRQIGSDILMAFDECAPYPCSHEYAKNSMELTHRWLNRCIAFGRQRAALWPQSELFPIVQGSTYSDLRVQPNTSLRRIEQEMRSVASRWEPAEEMYSMCAEVCSILPKDRPRYLMGVGTPANLLENIAFGVDMFDCVMPTRNGRNGMLFTSEGILNMKNARWADDFGPIDPNGSCFVDSAYSKGYLRHLFTVNEYLAGQIASIHNLRFYLWLMEEARAHIEAGDFAAWKTVMVEKWAADMMLKILDRYILVKFLGTFFVAIALILMIAWSSTSLKDRRLVSKGASLGRSSWTTMNFPGLLRQSV